MEKEVGFPPFAYFDPDGRGISGLSHETHGKSKGQRTYRGDCTGGLFPIFHAATGRGTGGEWLGAQPAGRKRGMSLGGESECGGVPYAMVSSRPAGSSCGKRNCSMDGVYGRHAGVLNTVINHQCFLISLSFVASFSSLTFFIRSSWAASLRACS